MIQQLGQSGQFSMPGMGQGNQHGQQGSQGTSQMGAQQGMSSGMASGMPGMTMPQGMGLSQNMISPEMLNSMTPQQKQMLMAQYAKMGMGVPGFMGGQKKDEDKK